MSVLKEGLKTEIVQVAPWNSHGWLRHGFSTRRGGISTIYGEDSLNLGWTKEDNPTLVAENRRRFLWSVCGDLHDKDELQTVTLKQIHSELVRSIHEEDRVREETLQTTEGKAVLEGDGLLTDLSGVMLGVQTADCVPVLVVDVRRRVVAAFHAGWRGTVARIVERGIEKLRLEYGSQPEDLMAAVGPSIGACCYSVGDEVRSEFGSQFDYAEKLFHETNGTAMYLDLWEANRRQLQDAGVQAQGITVIGECTACTVSNGERKYFSHRAEHGFTGRMMSMIGMV